MLFSDARNYDEVSWWHVVLHYLSDRTYCVNDSRSSRVGYELLQRFEGTSAIGIK